MCGMVRYVKINRQPYIIFKVKYRLDCYYNQSFLEGHWDNMLTVLLLVAFMKSVF